MARPKSQIPDDILALRTRLAEWRDTHPPRSPLPEELWQEAIILAARHGVHRTARALPVDYAGLNKRAGKGRRRSPAAIVRRIAQPEPPAGFVDLMLMPQQPQQQPGVVVELLRIQAHGPLDWSQLLTAWQQPQPKP